MDGEPIVNNIKRKYTPASFEEVGSSSWLFYDEVITEDLKIKLSGALPSDWLLSEMQKRKFVFTGNFIDAPQSAVLNYQPPSTGGNSYNLSKMRYKLKVQTGFVGTLIWFEEFTPLGATKPTKYLPMSCAITSGMTEAPGGGGFYTIDPSGADQNDANHALRDPNQNGAWQVVLPSFKLLNGDTTAADVDGIDFFGNRPTTRDYDYLATDNTSTASVIRDLGGENKLGILPLNNSYVSGASVNSILVEADVPPSTSGITYSWLRSYHDCSATIIHSDSQWNVASVNGIDNGNPTQQSNDSHNSDSYTTTVSPKNLLYYADAPGANLTAYFSACQVNDFAYEQTDFTYTLTINVGTTTGTSILHVGQVIIAKRTALTGNVEDQWEVLQNTITTTNIPTCQVTTTQVDAIVGGTPAVSIDPAVNENLYKE